MAPIPIGGRWLLYGVDNIFMVAVVMFLLRSNWRNTVYNVLEGGVMPMVVFYTAYATIGVWAALWACIGWTCITLVYRYVNHSRVSGLIILAAATVFARLHRLD